MKSRIGFGLVVILVSAAISACSDDHSVGLQEPEFSVAPTSGAPGSRLEVRGLPAGTSGATHWLEIGGRRTAIFQPAGGISYAVVPAFIENGDVWPTVPSHPVDIELRDSDGSILTARQSFTVLPLPRADGTTAALVDDLSTITGALQAIADRIPPGAGETARFAYTTSRVLDSLEHAPEFSVAAALAELEATTPEVLPLTDALLASSELHLPVRDLAHRLNGVAMELQALSASHSSAAASGSYSDPIELLDDETLSILMQLAVYLRQNTALQASLGSDLSSTFGLLGALGLNLDVIWNKVPIGKVISAVSAQSTMQALLLNKYLVAALPSVLDSLTLELATTSLSPGQQTDATVEVHVSNKPDAVTLGDLLSGFQNIAGLIVDASYLENTANYIIGKVGDLMQSYANGNPDVTYDANIVDLWSVPQLSFKAVVTHRDLVDLTSLRPDVVEPLEAEVNWVARSDTAAETTINIEPSKGNATIPVLAEWLADIISVNSGDASEMVMGAFGEEIMSAEPVEVLVELSVCTDESVELELDFGTGEPDPVVEGPILSNGVDYLITVSGTFSIWDSQWQNGECKGEAHAGSGGPTGLDSEYWFAIPGGSVLCQPSFDCCPSDHSKFEISVDGGGTFDHVDPVEEAYNPAHVYQYRVTGAGLPVQFMLEEDSARGDDYGILQIRIDCAPEESGAPSG